MTNANTEITQFPAGVGTRADDDILAKVRVPIPGDAFAFDDLDNYTLFDTLVGNTAIAAGATPSFPLSNSGVLRQVSAGADGDGNEANVNAGGGQADTFQLVSTRPAYYGCRFRIDDAVQSTIILGFVPNGSALAPADGMYFRKTDGDDEAFLIIENNAAAQTSVSLGDIVADTWYEMGIFWDGEVASCQFRAADGSGGGNSVEPGANLPAVGLEPTFTFAAGEAAAKTFDVDYYLFGGGRD